MALFINQNERVFHLEQACFRKLRDDSTFRSEKEMMALHPGSPVRVQADGDELDFILSKFKGIRCCTARVQLWTGDDARFILDHLAHVG